MTVTCHAQAQAVKLKALVDDNVMPGRAVLDAYGLLWVLGEEAEES